MVILQTTSQMIKEEIENLEKELTLKMGTKVVILPHNLVIAKTEKGVV